MGYFQREIAEAASDYQRRVDSNRRVIVGLNNFNKDAEAIEIPILEISKEVQDEQINSLKILKNERDSKLVNKSLANITDASINNQNLVPFIIEAAKAYATLGEIVDSMKIVFGEWQESTAI